MARNPDRRHDHTQIQQAILKTLVYADLFDYPLSSDEILRYLTVPASSETVQRILNHGTLEPEIDRSNGYFTLPGRAELGPLRERREVIADEKWSAAERYARWIARLPFVRMIAVTGTLAVRNVEAADDIDLFIVTATGRLWLCRALTILVVRAAAAAGDEVCPNYFVSERELSFNERNFFAARELAQMVPLYGAETYERMWNLNEWVNAYLPQATGSPNRAPIMRLSRRESAVKRAAERLLSGRLGARLERWEMQRKIRKFRRRAQAEGGSIEFTADCCKGHFDHHDEIIMRYYTEHLDRYGLSEEKLNG